MRQCTTDTGTRSSSPFRPRDQGAMRPGAGKADVQPVAAGLGTMSARAARSRAAIGGQPVAEARLLAPEPAVLRRVVPLVVPFAFDQQAHWILLRSAQSVDRKRVV